MAVVHNNTLSDLLAKSLKMSGRGPDSVDSLRSLATCLALGQLSISFELAREAPSFSYNCGAAASRTILKRRFFHSLITDFCTRPSTATVIVYLHTSWTVITDRGTHRFSGNCTPTVILQIFFFNTYTGIYSGHNPVWNFRYGKNKIYGPTDI